MSPEAQHESKTKLLNAALQVIRAKGYAATMRIPAKLTGHSAGT